jgi:hypothetical protein
MGAVQAQPANYRISSLHSSIHASTLQFYTLPYTTEHQAPSESLAKMQRAALSTFSSRSALGKPMDTGGRASRFMNGMQSTQLTRPRWDNSLATADHMGATTRHARLSFCCSTLRSLKLPSHCTWTGSVSRRPMTAVRATSTLVSSREGGRLTRWLSSVHPPTRRRHHPTPAGRLDPPDRGRQQGRRLLQDHLPLLRPRQGPAVRPEGARQHHRARPGRRRPQHAGQHGGRGGAQERAAGVHRRAARGRLRR